MRIRMQQTTARPSAPSHYTCCPMSPEPGGRTETVKRHTPHSYTRNSCGEPDTQFAGKRKKVLNGAESNSPPRLASSGILVADAESPGIRSTPASSFKITLPARSCSFECLLSPSNDLCSILAPLSPNLFWGEGLGVRGKRLIVGQKGESVATASISRDGM